MTERKSILVLEDNEERIGAFQKAVATLGERFELTVWREAHSMIEECEGLFASAALISLDHDLNPLPNATRDPGTGLEVAQYLADFLPVCPVLIHSSNTDRVYSMHNELRFSKWTVDRVGPIGADWVEKFWLPTARRLLEAHSNTWRVNLPPDHEARVERMRLSLDGLSLGDALGEMLSYQAQSSPRRLENNDLPSGPWFHTDDTEMALSVVNTLRSHGCINEDALAKRFARRFERDPDRGYGKMTRMQLRDIIAGADWRVTAANAFSGNGSMGNGSAMRVAPLGAYFAEDLKKTVEQAALSSAVTHTHPEGIAGAIATAVAAAKAWDLRQKLAVGAPTEFFEAVMEHTPESKVRRGVLLASQTPAETTPADAAKILGKGDLVTAPDTVPFCVWIAAHHLGNYVMALSKTICVGGDCDTNAAIVGGIVALSAGRESIPGDWLRARQTNCK